MPPVITSRQSAWRLAALFLWRDARARELNLLFLSVLVAIAAITTVGFFVDRLNRAWDAEASHLLGADLVIRADRPLPASWSSQARARGLQIASSVAFPSMVMAAPERQNVDVSEDGSAEDDSLPSTRLAAVLAVSHAYPLRGSLTVTADIHAAEAPGAPVSLNTGPAPGTVFIDETLAGQLGVKPGGRLILGHADFLVSRLIRLEPGRGAAFTRFAPRLMLSLDDLARTGLVRPGSRLTYSLLLAGQAPGVAAFRQWLTPQLSRGQHLENLGSGRPDVQRTLMRAQQFLALVSLLTAVIAAVAIGLGARSFAERHLQGFAVLKAMGIPQTLLLHSLTLEMFGLALISGAAGVVLGWLGHHALTGLAGLVLDTALPGVSWQPAAQAMLLAIVLVLGFALLPVLRLAGIPPLRAMRQDLDAPQLSVWLLWGVALLAFGVLMFWLVGDIRLLLYALGGFAQTILIFMLLTMFSIWLARFLASHHIRGGGGQILRLAILGWSRHPSITAVQVIALSSALMALLLLTVVRHDLVGAWEQSIPVNAPDHFMINIQPEQRDAVQQALGDAGLGRPVLYPVVRARLVAINNRPVQPQAYPSEQARRLLDREFNLSYTEALPEHNRLETGRWIRPDAAEVSVEAGIMKTLNLKLGDEVQFDIGGQSVTLKLVGSRRLRWDSMRVNFFMIGSPSALASMPQSLITSFRVPVDRASALVRLNTRMPNLTIIDIGMMVGQVRALIDQLVQAVRLLFLFTLLAGCVVLHGALGRVRDERMADTALMRVLGASRRQLIMIQIVELGLTALLAATMGTVGATLLGWLLAYAVFDFPYYPDIWLLLSGLLASATFILVVGTWNTWRLFDIPPLRILQQR